MVSLDTLLTGPHVSEHVISSLTRCGLVHQAIHVFMECPHRSVFSWTTLISASSNSEALKMYDLMQDDGVQPNQYTLVSLLKACGNLSNGVVQGMKLHGFAYKSGLSEDPYVACGLVSMYGKLGFLSESERVFLDSVSQLNVFLWNAMLSVYVEYGPTEKALLLYRQMKVEFGTGVNRVTFMTIFRACGILGDTNGDGSSDDKDVITNGIMWLQIGRALHADACSNDLCLLDDVSMATTLVDMYSKCGAIEDAEHVFSALNRPDVVSWNTLLSAYLKQCSDRADLVLWLYRQMHEQGIVPNAYTLVHSVKACGMMAIEKGKAFRTNGREIKAMALEIGQALHVDALSKKLLSGSHFVATALMGMYNNCGDIRKAEEVFVECSQRDIVTWNAMLSAYVEHGLAERALRLYRQMQEEIVDLNHMTFVSACQACSILAESEEPDSVCGQEFFSKAMSLEIGRSVYAHAWRKGQALLVAASLIILFGKCGAILDAERVFTALSYQDVVLWTALLSAYVDNEQRVKALQLFKQMQVQGLRPNRHSFVCALQGCGSFEKREETLFRESRLTTLISLEICQALHADLGQRNDFLSDPIVSTALLTAYAECGSIEEANSIFFAMPCHDAISWNAILSAYLKQGEGEKTLRLYRDMQTEEGVIQDQMTVALAIRACSILQLSDKAIILEIGNALHMDAIKQGHASKPTVANMLMAMYCKCGNVQKAEDVLFALPEPTPSAWNTLLFACIEVHQDAKILQLYSEIRKKDGMINEYSFVGVLQSCREIGSLTLCQYLHFDIIASACDLISWVASSLIQTYGKYASTLDSQAIFEGFEEPDIVLWTACIQGYAGEGNAISSLCMYERLKMSGIDPDQVSFNCILLACSHDGLVSQCIEFFEVLIGEYKMMPQLRHYGLLVDGLGRAGDFRRLESMLMKIPMPIDVTICVSVLTACRAHGGNIELAEEFFDRVINLAVKQEASAYILMSNIYTDAGLQSHVTIHESE